MAPSAATPNLSDEDVARLLTLIKDVDSVELKLTVPEADQRSTITALELDPHPIVLERAVLVERAGAVADLDAELDRGGGPRPGQELERADQDVVHRSAS